jgi:hypothetical protein
VTPDGTRAVFTPLSAVDYSFWSASTATGVAAALPNTNGAAASLVVMSPDGSHFAFDYGQTSAVASTTLGNQTTLPAASPRFTKDSQYLVVAYPAFDDLAVVPVASGTPVTGPSNVSWVTPAHDDWIVYVASTGVVAVAAGDLAHPRSIGTDPAATLMVNRAGTIVAYTYTNGASQSSGLYAAAIP